MDAQVRAAGGVVWRAGSDGAQLAIIHRPRQDDWSLPKGKLDPGEGWEECALREVHEEIGMRCRLGSELPSTRYRDARGRTKVVRYWLMEPVSGSFSPNSEVDELHWLTVAEAADRLSYQHDRELLAAAAAPLAQSAARA